MRVERTTPAGVLLLVLLAFPGYESVAGLRDAARAALPIWRMGFSAADEERDRINQGLATVLPATGRIGFVRTPVGDRAVLARDLIFLQYSLAPREIVSSWEPAIVLLHGDPSTVEAMLRQHSLEMTHDLGGDWRVFGKVRR